MEEIRERQDNRFFEAIAKGALSGAYYLHGDEPYTRARALGQITARLNPDLSGMNLVKLTAPTGQDVINASETLPFFDAQRVVIVTGLTADGAEPLKEYVSKVPDTTLLLFVVGGKATSASPLYPAMQKLGRTVEFEPYPPGLAASFLAKRAAENDIRLDRVTAMRLIDMVGLDLAALESALLKVGAYAGGAPLHQRMLDVCITPNLEYTVFAMLDAFVSGRQKEGLTMLQTQLKNGESALGLAAFFLGRIKQMLLARELLDSGKGDPAVQKALGGSPYAAKMTIKNARHMTKAQLQNAVLAFSAVDSMQKRGVMKDQDALLIAIFKTFSPNIQSQKGQSHD